MARRIPKAYKDVLAIHRQRLAGLTGRSGLQPLLNLYRKAQFDIERRLARVARSAPGSFGAHQQRLFLGQIRQGIAILLRQMNGAVGDLTKRAQVSALKGLLADINRLEKKFTGAEIVLPIEEASKFQGIVSGRRASMLRASQTSMADYGARLISKLEDQLSLSMITGDTLADTINRINDVVDMEWYQAERIARTESAWAFNSTHHDGMLAARQELPDLMMRWVEYVDDTTLMPLDDRVDEDSIAMHGQVASPDGYFYFPNTMPDGSPIPRRLERFRGESWDHPPHRPNDRATLAPWRPHWGVPAWRWEGRRVPL